MRHPSLLLIIILIGLIIIILPDSDVRLFSISKDHGPSLQDAIGILLIVLPYLMLVKEAWSKREKILNYRHSKIFYGTLFLLGLGYGLIIASVANDYRFWWVYGIALLILINIIILYFIFK